jgi:hypothetical protein
MARPVVAGLLMQAWVRVHSLAAMAIWVDSSAGTAVCEPRCEGYFRVRVLTTPPRNCSPREAIDAVDQGRVR